MNHSIQFQYAFSKIIIVCKLIYIYIYLYIYIYIYIHIYIIFCVDRLFFNKEEYISVFILQNAVVNYICYLPFLCNCYINFF